MALAFDALANNSSGWTTSASSLTWLHTCTGANRFLLVGVVLFNSGGGPVTVSGITYAGVALTKVGSIAASLEGSSETTELWYLDAPATGSNSVIATLSGTTSHGNAFSSSYTGKTVTGVDASATSQNTSASTSAPACNVTVVHSDCWLASVAFSRDASDPTAGAGTTIRGTDGGIGHAFGDSNGVVSTGSQTLAYTSSGSATWPGVVSCSFSSANVGGGTPQLLAPIQDISAGPWLPSSGSPALLFEMLDGEKSPDTDYAFTASLGTMEVKFAAGGTPSVQTGHVLRYRLRGDGSTDAVITLKCGATVIAQWTELNVPAVDTDYSHTLDSSPSFTISDYTDLRISVEAA